MKPAFAIGDTVRVRLYLRGIGGLYGVIHDKVHNEYDRTVIWRVHLEDGRTRDLWPGMLEALTPIEREERE